MSDIELNAFWFFVGFALSYIFSKIKEKPTIIEKIDVETFKTNNSCEGCLFCKNIQHSNYCLKDFTEELQFGIDRLDNEHISFSLRTEECKEKGYKMVSK